MIGTLAGEPAAPVDAAPVAAAPPAPTAPTAPARFGWPLRARNWLPPGWPLTAAIVGYPLWWLVGIASFVPLITAVFMVRELRRMPSVRVRRSFGLLVLFIVWAAAGALLVQVNAVGAVAGGSGSRYLTFAFRMGWYLAAVIALVYVYNKRDELSTQRIVRAFSTLFITVVVGGVIGTLFYTIDFPSLLEIILPRGVTHVEFVHILVHPTISQIYTSDGFVNPRASAPFPFTNDWGLNFTCLLPFFLVGWCGKDAGWRRKVAPFILIAAIFTVVMTQNRGAWATLGVLAVLIALRGLVFGQLRAVAVIGALFAVIAVVLLGTPLGATIDQRLNGPTSNQGRANLGQLTVNSVLNTSPVAGLGTTRRVQGALYSIAGGDSATCPGCSAPDLGTQGHFWLLIYTSGVGGAVLYLGFLITQLIRHARLRSTAVTLGLSVIVVHLCTMFVYDSVDVALVTIFVAVGLLWREARAAESTAVRPGRDLGDVALSAYPNLVRAQRTVIVAGVLLGLIGGLAYTRLSGQHSVATATVILPSTPAFPGTTVRPPAQSADTMAQFINSPVVLSAIARATGESVHPGPHTLWVTATPNSRLLHVQFESTRPNRAGAGAAAAATALLTMRAQLLDRARAEAISELQAQAAELRSTIFGVEAAQRIGHVVKHSAQPLHDTLVIQLVNVTSLLARTSADPIAAGTTVSVSVAAVGSDAMLIAVTTGMLLGMITGVGVAIARQRNGAPFVPRSPAGLAGLPVVFTLPDRVVSGSYTPAARALHAMRVEVIVGIEGRPRTLVSADRLRAVAAPPITERSRRAAIVVEAGTPSAELQRVVRQLQAAGVESVGLVLCSPSRHVVRPPRWSWPSLVRAKPTMVELDG